MLQVCVQMLPFCTQVYTELCKLQGAATYMSHLQPGSTLSQEIKTLLESDQGTPGTAKINRSKMHSYNLTFEPQKN